MSPAEPTVTVTVVAAARAPAAHRAVTSTLVAPSSSDTEPGLTDSSTESEASSSSSSARVADSTLSPLAAPATVIVSSPPAIPSSVGVSVNESCPRCTPAGIVSVKSETAS